MSTNPIPNTLRPLSRYITTTDSQGKATVSDAIPPPATWQHLGPDASFFLGYCTATIPADLSTPPAPPSTPPQTADDSPDPIETKSTEPLPADIQTYTQYLNQPPGLVINSGTVLRVVDMAPSHTSPMHRTLSLDYGIVVEGEIELITEGGETRLMKRGDICVQRATSHAWRNLSSTQWARMVFVLVPCTGVAGSEDLGGMEGVRESH